jgi:hypothetical protein
MHARELTVDMPYGGEVLSSSTAIEGCNQLPATRTVKANVQSTNTAGTQQSRTETPQDQEVSSSIADLQVLSL